MRRLGLACVLVSLVLHGAVAVVVLARSGTSSPQQATIYEILLATSPASAGSSLPKPQINKKSGVTAPSQPDKARHEKPAYAIPVAQPVVPTATVPAAPAVTAQVPVSAAVASPVPSSAGSVGGGISPAVHEDGHSGPALQFGSSGAPSFSRQVAPVYPAQARRLGREGMVVLKLAIDAEGRLQGVEVVQAASFGFTEAALTAIRQSSYRPALKAGRPVQAQALITIRFTLRS
jgi:protein TonB